jgi:carbon monoxide dehydrogenase subunit G
VQLENSFHVPSGIEEAWAALQDVELLAPCMPGATLTAVNGDSFDGAVKVKLGPVTMTYGGRAHFSRRDAESKVMVIEGAGRDSRGTGTASGTATVTLTSDSPTSTRVDVLTEFTVTGKAAQFGRGVMQDVAGRIVDQFAANLAAALEARAVQPQVAAIGASRPIPGSDDAMSPGPRAFAASSAQDDDSIDLLGAAGAPVLKRVLPVVVAAIVAGVVIWWFRR